MPKLCSVPLAKQRHARRALVATVLTIVVMTIATPVPNAAALPLPQLATTSCADAEEQALLDQMNTYRAQNGLGPLQLSQTLGAAADAHSIEMATNSYFDHTMLGGVTVEQNLQNFGYGDATYGENIAGGMENGAGAFAAWQGSPSHNANMLRAEYAAIGIARAYDASSGYGWYWTTIFGGSVDTPGILCDGAATTAPATTEVVSEPATVTTLGANGATTDDLNLRSGPGASYSTLGTVPANSRLNVSGAAEAGYYPVSYGEQTGWVAAEFVVVDSEAAAEPELVESAQTVPGRGTTEGRATEPLNLRSGPGRESEVLLTMPEGSVVPLSGEANNGYLNVTYNGTTGWVDAAYLSLSEPAPASTTADPGSLVVPVTAGGAARTTTDLNLRGGPGVSESVLLVIPGGEPLALTGEVSGDYVGVSYNGAQGWVDANFLTTLSG
ncbi:MAG: SH3 domain-containing protein [Chloroflexota bacterium]|nr:SH3 domain-containing protein [Chloroflexota bacterium]